VWTVGGLKRVNIEASPYYIALRQNDPAEFYVYHEAMRALLTASSEISWTQFLDLRDDIASNGLRDLDSPIRVDEGGQSDGHHRLAILGHLYGTEVNVLIDRGVVTFPAPTRLEVLLRKAWIGAGFQRKRTAWEPHASPLKMPSELGPATRRAGDAAGG
jgi:hypothetical protein